ncbi:hypothetical protein [Pseudomonas sp. 10S4]|uniref:hypothetical protein n=1 Tax=Pseudomonas sp. 10S4 TaxID=3048583 RepID=UPI002AC93A7E|nr:MULTISPECIES: hypothetical protein [unclassified Pseudomonas]MEB0226256.1 hypothetical protein [Pseudomonas sp. 5S1]MEB0294923.1 hypothetical protein [Pseudomonas sp. 10S4]WPX18133.1 hypothetical protein RHM58_31035 [Pseudomonas sp. 10S4]
MKQDVVRIAKKLTILTVVLAALSAYGANSHFGLETWAGDIGLFAGLWVAALPMTALIVLIFAIPWYSIKWYRNRRSNV